MHSAMLALNVMVQFFKEWYWLTPKEIKVYFVLNLSHLCAVFKLIYQD